MYVSVEHQKLTVQINATVTTKPANDLIYLRKISTQRILRRKVIGEE